MIRLIATDIDGTLVPEGAPQADPRLPGIIRELKERGVYFVAASGREYPNLVRMFDAVKDEIYFITTNGSKVMYRGGLVSSAPMEQELVEDIVKWLRTQPQKFLILSTLEDVWSDSEDLSYVQKVQDQFHIVNLKMTEDVLAVKDPVIKIAAHAVRTATDLTDEALRLFGDRAHVMQAGSHWLDFVDKEVDKARALRAIQAQLGISPAETMAFGDNANDAGMLRLAGISYAAAGAVPEAKAAAGAVLPDDPAAVVDVLERFLADPENFVQ